ncbi:amidase domain-containing protein [Saccharomonospora glauca]|mgnify:CR=1 FL=1|uniref:Putative amidase domain-containing protein n=1 Tax=Saccharomonospora glauca K62 TaxID=928724 RepID=I1D5K9_9PSEU|nr:amidase domain-containing protein [Saccharomonospora glauca]EIF00234.1 hypothetical protein SacglDRAFT_03373 [Saccharomonospora glauca K62]
MTLADWRLGPTIHYMITYQQLRDVNPDMFATAADDWLVVAKEAETAADDIYESDADGLEDNWTDELGEQARAECQKIAQDYHIAALASRGVLTVLDGFADAVRMVKRNLESAVDFATGAGLSVSDDGHVTVPPGNDDPRAAEQAARANELVIDALTAATRIDEEARTALYDLVRQASIDTVMSEDEIAETVLNGPVKAAGLATLEMIKESMPLDESAEEQTAWWHSLNPEQQREYMRAAPVELHDMAGIPDTVKRELIGNDGMNRVEMVRWAQQYGETEYRNIPGMANCTNFVSYAMHEGGGVPENADGITPYDEDDWSQDHDHWGIPGLNELDKQQQSASWAAARNHHDYMLSHGGETVSPAEAMPGDIIYFENTEGIHHAAVVTAITPDGEIMYTQHTGEHTNLSLTDRQAFNNIYSGEDTPIIVRPHPDWI